MLQISSPVEVRHYCDHQRQQGQRIGFVPTMGFLHQGHLALIRRAYELADAVVVSIFVNPTQFGPEEDLERYPRDLPSDLAKCDQEKVDLVFIPERQDMYPAGFQTFIEIEQLSQGLCGTRRPGHFRGVATVVTKFFNIIGPCVAVFGEKDYQQLQVIRRMVLDLDQPVEVVGHPTVREADGLALSSRNAYLSAAGRQSATSLYRALVMLKERCSNEGLIDADEAKALVRRIVEAEPDTTIDYIEVRDAETLRPSAEVGGGRSVVALAVFLGQTRLIDNLVV